MAEAPSVKQLEINIPMEDGDPLGAVPNDKLIITKIQPGTLAEGKLRIGDQIQKVNGKECADQNTFFRLLRFATPIACITVTRDEKKAQELEARVHIPADREKLIQRRDGFTYFLMKIVWVKGGPKLGLGIKHFQNRVLVSRCEPGTLSAEHLTLGDHIIDIDGTPVTDKDVAKDLLVKSLLKNGSCTGVVERPESMEAKHWTNQALAANVAQPPSVQMNSDVRAIAAKERARIATLQVPAHGILGGKLIASRHVIIKENETKTLLIASDNVGRQLRPVRK